MSKFTDLEFGEITVRRSANARSMKASVAPNGTLRISLPPYVPIIMAKRMVSSSRNEIRKLFSTQTRIRLTDGMAIGKSHHLHVRQGEYFSIQRIKQQIIVTLADQQLETPSVDAAVRAEIVKALRKEAKHYLPKRLEYLANEHGFSYKKVRFSHASSRWGSCSSNGTISLNIALMMLDFELIDYVIIHELAHTKQMNHSAKFWDIVESVDPNFKAHRKEMKQRSPNL